jgi:formate-nitrite transporter family protein
VSEDAQDDEQVEREVEEDEFDAVVEEGAERLHRSWRAVLVTGFAGGLEIGLGVIAYLAVLDATGSVLLAGVAFSIGLIALLLAHSELLTENLFLPIAALVAREGTVLQLARLWAGTLVANLAGGAVVMTLVVAAFPSLHRELVSTARHYLDVGFGWEGIALALLAGLAITLATRMQQGTESDGVRVVVAVVDGFVLAGLQLMHSMLDALFVTGAVLLDRATLLEAVAWFVPTLLLNMAGGLLLVTVLRLIRTKELLAERRGRAPRLRED